uniref:F-box/LRR-repeat MAX2 homolog n=1 Tax=Elaeis guineensis var. tenera TaxID=51953 RepID=A0A6I9S2U8_ELAGV|nr:F-box/LRR-repeat MAX2 homolog [Elaeis guineensis]
MTVGLVGALPTMMTSSSYPTDTAGTGGGGGIYCSRNPWGGNGGWWPGVRHAKLVGWHQWPHHLPGTDLTRSSQPIPPLPLSTSPTFTVGWRTSPALQAHPSTAASVALLDLLSASFAEGFHASELAAIATACSNLLHLLAPCNFNPRYFEFVGNASILHLAVTCPCLSLHLVEPSTPSPACPIPDPANDGLIIRDDVRITIAGLESLFAAFPELEDLALDLSHNVRDIGLALEALSHKCPRIKTSRWHFHGICRAAWLLIENS